MKSPNCLPVSDGRLSVERSEALVHTKSGFRPGADPNKLLGGRCRTHTLQVRPESHKGRPQGRLGSQPRGARHVGRPDLGVSGPSTSTCAHRCGAPEARAGPSCALCARSVWERFRGRPVTPQSQPVRVSETRQPVRGDVPMGPRPSGPAGLAVPKTLSPSSSTRVSPLGLRVAFQSR